MKSEWLYLSPAEEAVLARVVMALLMRMDYGSSPDAHGKLRNDTLAFLRKIFASKRWGKDIDQNYVSTLCLVVDEWNRNHREQFDFSAIRGNGSGRRPRGGTEIAEHEHRVRTIWLSVYESYIDATSIFGKFPDVREKSLYLKRLGSEARASERRAYLLKQARKILADLTARCPNLDRDDLIGDFCDRCMGIDEDIVAEVLGVSLSSFEQKEPVRERTELERYLAEQEEDTRRERREWDALCS